jgi:hypothetical protein
VVRGAPQETRSGGSRGRFVSLLVGGAVLLADCATPVAVPNRPPALSPGSARSAATATTSSTTPPTVSSGAPAIRWPPLVVAAMERVHPVAGLRPEAPTSLPGPTASLPSTANSAWVENVSGGYLVSLFACPDPLPVDSPNVGTGACGAMSSIYGSFGARKLASPEAAAALVSPARTPGSPCVATTVTVATGIPATLYVTPGDPLACELRWTEGTWSFLLEGGLSAQRTATPTPLDGAAPWGPIARSIVRQGVARSLLRARGTLVADVAPDGIHTSLRWAMGDTVYQAGAEHGAALALALADSMAPHPG